MRITVAKDRADDSRGIHRTAEEIAGMLRTRARDLKKSTRVLLSDLPAEPDDGIRRREDKGPPGDPAALSPAIGRIWEGVVPAWRWAHGPATAAEMQRLAAANSDPEKGGTGAVWFADRDALGWSAAESLFDEIRPESEGDADAARAFCEATLAPEALAKADEPEFLVGLTVGATLPPGRIPVGA